MRKILMVLMLLLRSRGATVLAISGPTEVLEVEPERMPLSLGLHGVMEGLVSQQHLPQPSHFYMALLGNLGMVVVLVVVEPLANMEGEVVVATRVVGVAEEGEEVEASSEKTELN